MDDLTFRAVLARAVLAPSVHNVQPARCRRVEDGVIVAADLAVGLAVGDPEGADAGLSCGAMIEAFVLAASAVGVAVSVEDLWLADDKAAWPGHRLAARLRFAPGEVDPLHDQLEARFTWRGPFGPAPDGLSDWHRDDAVMVRDAAARARVAARNDWASLQIMRHAPFRRELRHWMRLSPGHPRYAHDGLNRAAMRMGGVEAMLAPWALGVLWPLMDRLGATRGMTAEAGATVTAPVIACFHRPEGESPVTSGRAYLRMCLEAAARGMAGWPMAALSDHPVTAAQIKAEFGIGSDRRLVQVIRFGVPTGPMPARARRPLSEVYSG